MSAVEAIAVVGPVEETGQVGPVPGRSPSETSGEDLGMRESRVQLGHVGLQKRIETHERADERGTDAAVMGQAYGQSAAAERPTRPA